MSSPWHEIHDHLKHTSSTLSFQRCFVAIRHAHDLPGHFGDPAALLDGLHRGSNDPERKNRILTALVRAAQNGGAASDCALTLVLLALWPGLDAIRRRSLWRRIGSADEVASDVLARSTEAIRGLDLERVSRIAATVLRNVERDMVRTRQRDAARESHTSDIAPDDVPADCIGRQPAAEEAQLRDDLRKLIGADAGLVIRVAIEGFTQAEVAVELGLTEGAARKRYQRALRKLRDALAEIP